MGSAVATSRLGSVASLVRSTVARYIKRAGTVASQVSRVTRPELGGPTVSAYGGRWFPRVTAASRFISMGSSASFGPSPCSSVSRRQGEVSVTSSGLCRAPAAAAAACAAPVTAPSSVAFRGSLASPNGTGARSRRSCFRHVARSSALVKAPPRLTLRSLSVASSCNVAASYVPTVVGLDRLRTVRLRCTAIVLAQVVSVAPSRGEVVVRMGSKGEGSLSLRCTGLDTCICVTVHASASTLVAMRYTVVGHVYAAPLSSRCISVVALVRTVRERFITKVMDASSCLKGMARVHRPHALGSGLARGLDSQVTTVVLSCRSDVGLARMLSVFCSRLGSLDGFVIVFPCALEPTPRGSSSPLPRRGFLDFDCVITRARMRFLGTRKRW